VLLDSLSVDYGLHELDFRFEQNESTFLFAHHGLNLADLAETIDLSRLGRSFYAVEFRMPFTLDEVIADRSLFSERYDQEPEILYGRYPWFDLLALERFFRATKDEGELDCIIIGMDEGPLVETEFETLAQRFQNQDRSSPSLPWNGSWLHTHDNHFCWLRFQSPHLLRTLIAESILGFFHHVQPGPYSPVPESLIDLVCTEYQIAPLVCYPTERVRGKEIPSSVQRDEHGLQALLETAESSWIAYQLNPPRELVGRGLLVSYDFRSGSWSFEPWS